MAVILLTRPQRRKLNYVTASHPFKIRLKIQRKVKISPLFRSSKVSLSTVFHHRNSVLIRFLLHPHWALDVY